MVGHLQGVVIATVQVLDLVDPQPFLNKAKPFIQGTGAVVAGPDAQVDLFKPVLRGPGQCRRHECRADAHASEALDHTHAQLADMLPKLVPGPEHGHPAHNLLLQDCAKDQIPISRGLGKDPFFLIHADVKPGAEKVDLLPGHAVHGSDKLLGIVHSNLPQRS